MMILNSWDITQVTQNENVVISDITTNLVKLVKLKLNWTKYMVCYLLSNAILVIRQNVTYTTPQFNHFQSWKGVLEALLLAKL